eukprot:m.217765 g.217765  ORF g.217765 m.217765 type:complete len:70 (+) comp26251_c1_seq9:721-930(+)
MLSAYMLRDRKVVFVKRASAMTPAADPKWFPLDFNNPIVITQQVGNIASCIAFHSVTPKVDFGNGSVSF